MPYPSFRFDDAKLLESGNPVSYTDLTQSSVSVMAQNIQLFGPREGFLTHQWIITENK